MTIENSTINLIWCIEKGLLENQTTLLLQSIQDLLKSKPFQLTAYSPRSKSQPTEKSYSLLQNQNVKHVTKPLNTSFINYPIANKLLACADFEKNHPDANRIMFVDTDTIFMNPISNKFLDDKPALYLRPVDNKGPGSESSEDPNDLFWQAVFRRFDLPLPEPNMQTTVRPSVIRPYFNAGFIWVNNIPDFYQQWLDDFLLLVDSGLRPFDYQSRDNDDFRCLDQVALAVTASRYQKHIKILPETFNYPIPFRPYMKERKNHPAFKDLVHIHYHRWFQQPWFLDHVTTAEDKKSKQYHWLKEQLPIHPVINDPFKC